MSRDGRLHPLSAEKSAPTAIEGWTGRFCTAFVRQLRLGGPEAPPALCAQHATR